MGSSVKVKTSWLRKPPKAECVTIYSTLPVALFNADHNVTYRTTQQKRFSVHQQE